MAEARATEAAAHQANLISLIDLPEVGNRPIGPGRTVIVLGGLLGGLAIGAGIVLLGIQPASIEPATIAPATVGKHDLKLRIAQARQSVKAAVRKLGNSAAMLG